MGTRDHPGLLIHKSLEKDQGFLGHVSMTYDLIIPFLRGFHNSIDGWRDDSDEEGWKSEEGSSTWGKILNHYVETGKITEEEHDSLLNSQLEPSSSPKLYLIPVYLTM